MIDTRDIFNIKTESDFKTIAVEVFKYQFNNNSVYRSFCDLLCVNSSDVKDLHQIPFLPIQFFKTHPVLSTQNSIKTTFTSSGTTGQATSQHHVTDLKIYEESFKKSFNHFYGNIEDYTILALLPNYLERKGSSLVYMVNQLITDSKKSQSGFYLNNLNELKKTLITLNKNNEKVLNWRYEGTT